MTTYRYTIEIKPAVNYHTKAAEVYVVDHTCDGCSGNGIVVNQKHIGFFNTLQEAEVAAEKLCNDLHKKLKDICIEELKTLKNAEP